MHCTRCGQAAVPGTAFCAGCGNPIAGPSPAAALRRPTIVSVLAGLQYAGGAIALIAALGLFAAAGKGEERTFSLALGALFAVAGALQISCGFGLWNLRSWGRILQMVLAGIGLLGIPLGTVISILILVYMSKPGVKVLFSEKHPNTLTPAEIAAAWETNQGGGAGVVVAIVLGVFAGIFVLGIITAIAIPNFLNAVQRAKQKRTMSTMSEIATILEDRYREKKELPEVRSIEEFVGVFGAAGERLRRDGWNNEFRIVVNENGYVIASAGKDGVFSESPLEAYKPARTIEFNADLVMRDGEWIVAPEGLRR
jgi:type II secretory pathway pseudopilin PulG